jgi:dTDP-4-amino-4,6-dideoxygalactose transaminase
MVYYPVPLHRQPMFVALGFADGSLSEAERAAAEVLSLPIYPELTAQQIEHVAGALREAMQETQ